MNVFETHPNELVHLEYTLVGESGSHGLIGTPQHPFWSKDREEWVPMGELRIGERLHVDGENVEAVVVALILEIAPTGETFTTYNFEVAGWHTYFVAPKNSPPDAATIWVHNMCDAGVARLLAQIERKGSRHGDRVLAAIGGRLPDNQIQQIQAVIDQRRVPENATSRFNRVTTPWQRKVYQRADIDWDFVRPEGAALAGRTNRFAAAQGYAPGRINPKTGKWDDVVLHHLLDDPRGAVIETWRSSHTRFHNTIGRGPNDFNEFRGATKPWRKLHPEWEEAWNNEVHGYWSWRNGSRPNAPRRDRLMLPGDEP